MRLTLSHRKIGVLFNLPEKPIRGEVIDYVADAEIQDQVKAVQKAIEKLDLNCKTLPLKDDIESLVRELKLFKPDTVINLCEGAFGDSHLEMNVPSILELLRISYTGSTPLSLGLCQNKGLTKDILSANGIATPKFCVLKDFKGWNDDLDYPLFVKPLMEDASLGISKESFVRNEEALRKRVVYINNVYNQPALVEKYVYGREVNVAILGNRNPKVLPISEIMFEAKEEPKIVDYPAKWFTESSEYRMTKPMCPAKLEFSIKSMVEEAALKSYKALYCRDYARVDMRLEGDVPYVLEVNPNPDISPDAGFARSLKVADISFEHFIEKIVCFSLERRDSMKFNQRPFFE